jgi:crotonobetainyl-CoA:carnitine CoA-transferase CaiB-like acyl-CoA transferase
MNALEGIRVLDLGRTLPAPYCAMLLADMGAEVIRIEAPDLELPPYLAPQYLSRIEPEKVEETLAAYDFVNRNKRKLSLNLKVKEAKELFYRLVGNSDVVIEDFRPGVARRLGTDYDILKSLNPRIVYCAISGYGQDGPYRNRPGHDMNFMGVGGALGMIGTRQGEYATTGIPFSDLGSGMQGAFAVLCALFARVNTGEGQFIDVSMTDCVASWVVLRHGQLYFSTGKQQKIGERIPHVYETKDGQYVCLAAAEPHFWESFCTALGLPEYIPYRQDAMLFDLSGEGGKGKEITTAMARAFRTRTKKEWLDLLAESGLSPVYSTIGEVLADPQIAHRKMLTEVAHPTLGRVKQLGMAVKLSATPGGARMAPRKSGQDTEDILGELGCTAAQISGLREKRAIK